MHQFFLFILRIVFFFCCGDSLSDHLCIVVKKKKRESKSLTFEFEYSNNYTTRFDGYHVIGGERRTAHQDIRFDNTVLLIATESRVEDDEKEEIRLHQCFEKG